MIACTCMVPTGWNHGLHPLRTMVLKSPSHRKAHRSGWRGGFQDHGSERVQTMVSEHGFTKVGTMQVQAIMPPLTEEDKRATTNAQNGLVFFLFILI